MCVFARGNNKKAREVGLSQWEDTLKGQAKEASDAADKLQADRLAREGKFRELSEAAAAEERRLEELRSGLEQKEKALAAREANIAEMEAGREARAAELETVRDRLALLEKGLEGQRADLARRKVCVLNLINRCKSLLHVGDLGEVFVGVF